MQNKNLKSLTIEAKNKLVNSLKTHGVIDSFNVWEDKKSGIWILDGHHRQKIYTEFGNDIPKMLRANFIKCKDRQDAAKKVLIYSAIYAGITEDGLYEYLHDYDLSLNEIAWSTDLPGIDFDHYMANFGELEISYDENETPGLDLEKSKNTCPNCGFKMSGA